MTDIAVPEDLELLVLDARAAYALADAKYDRLIEAVDAENRRRMNEVHKILRAIGQGKCYECGNYRNISQLKLFYSPRVAYAYPKDKVDLPGNVFAACSACAGNSSKVNPNWDYPARIKVDRPP